MRRLIEETDPSDPTTKRAIQLLRSNPPIEISPSKVAGLRAAIGRSRPRPRWGLSALTGVTLAVVAASVWVLLHQPHKVVSTSEELALPPAVRPVAIEAPPSIPAIETSPRPQRNKKSPPASIPPASAEVPEHARTESELLVAATEQLRHQHAADRAAALLNEDLQRFPNGDLVEEAYALALEAEVSNPERAAALGREYLTRFPAGRFRRLAERATSRLPK